MVGSTGDTLVSLLGGLVVGALAGMSSEPMAGTIIGGLFAAVPILAGVFKTSETGPRPNLKHLQRLALCFLFLLPIGVGLGIYVRAHNWFRGSPYEVEINDLKAAGYTTNEAKELLASRLLKSPNVPSPVPIPFLAQGPALSKIWTIEKCTEFRPGNISGDYEKILRKYRESSGGPAILANIAGELHNKLPSADTNDAGLAVMTSLWRAVCEPQ